MNLNYNQNIPGSQNNPSDDQPLMRTNTNSIRTWVGIDHFGFNDNRGGLHKQTRIINQLAIPAGLTAQMGTIYTKLATSTGVLTESNIFFTPGTSANEYQITRVITASFALFGTLTNNYNAVGVDFFGGWTFLPGGLLYQYGRVLHGGATLRIVPFPVPFSDATSIVINLTAVSNNNSDHATNVSNGSITTTQFSLRTTSNSALTATTWFAIGK